MEPIDGLKEKTSLATFSAEVQHASSMSILYSLVFSSLDGPAFSLMTACLIQPFL